MKDIIVARLVSELPHPARGSEKANCETCRRGIWVARASRKRIREGLKAYCVACGMAAVEVGRQTGQFDPGERVTVARADGGEFIGAHEKRAKLLERYFNSPEISEKIFDWAERVTLNTLLYGPDRSRWPQ